MRLELGWTVIFFSCGGLKLQSCKLNNNKYMITSAQIKNTANFALIAVLLFKLLSFKVVFVTRKDMRNFKKLANF